MILEFSVKNFLSFKEKVTFSMIANSNKELNDNYVEIGGNKVLKSAAVPFLDILCRIPFSNSLF